MVENLYCSNTTGSILYLQPTDREIAMADRPVFTHPAHRTRQGLGPRIPNHSERILSKLDVRPADVDQ